MPTVEERLASLEAKVDTMSDPRTLLADLRRDVDARFTEVNVRFTEVTGRISALDVKIDRHFLWLMGMMLTGFTAVIGALVAVAYR